MTFRLLGKDCNDHLLHGGHFGGGLNEDAAAQQSKDAIIYVTVRERERTQLSRGGGGAKKVSRLISKNQMTTTLALALTKRGARLRATKMMSLKF